MTENKVIIVGAGISGATIARYLAEKNYNIEIYEKRDVVAGHIFDQEIEGIIVQKYGPHIFHTSKEKVIDFISKFMEKNNFNNKVEGFVKGKKIPIPFNFTGIDTFFKDDAEEIKKILLTDFKNLKSVPILELEKHNNPLIKKLSKFIYENIFENYTTKMWGLKPDEIDKSVTARVPIVLSYYDRYFIDPYEGIPIHGFTNVVENILNHKNIKVFLSNDADKKIVFKEDKILFNGEDNLVIYTGPIDKLFKNEYGILDYRSLKIDIEKLPISQYQETAVVNYPADPKMTRITEFQNFYPEKKRKEYTYISKEYPGAYNPDDKVFNEPYYPLASNKARIKYNRYSQCAKKYKNLLLLGRLARFEYINMDEAINQALELGEKIINEYK
ncbi:MAG: UDP-galactopyranose mutase [Metamycoplasmataceae bacterium]